MSIFTLLSGVMAWKASKAQAKQVQRGLDEQKRQYNQSRDDMMPWMEAGKRSLGDIERELGGNYEQSKGYQWQVDEGQKRVKSNLASLGMTNSGAALKSLTKWGQGLASQDYDKWYGRKESLAGRGQQQSQAMGKLGANYANSAASQYNHLGAAKASGYAGLGNMFDSLGSQASMAMGAGGGGGGGGKSGYGSVNRPGNNWLGG